MNDSFFVIFTVTRMLFFFAGMATACVWHWAKAKRAGIDVNWRYFGIIAGVAAMAFIAMQQISLSSQTQSCQRELISALTVNKRIGDTNDNLSEQQRKLLLDDNIALGDWIKKLLNPPMSRDLHPAYDDWGIKVTREYYERTSVIRGQLNALQAQVDFNEDERAKHPLPQPKCGLK